MNLREAMIVQSPSLEMHRAMQDEISRLDGALFYEQHRAGRMGTHSEGCWAWGPEHYECALRRIEAGQ